jgi:hypothetical protein
MIRQNFSRIDLGRFFSVIPIADLLDAKHVIEDE